MPKSTRGVVGISREAGFGTAEDTERGATRTADELGNAVAVGSGETLSIGIGASAVAGLGDAARFAAAEEAVSDPDAVGHESSPAAGGRPRRAAGVEDGVVET
jgi:hypothetical protein